MRKSRKATTKKEKKQKTYVNGGLVEHLLEDARQYMTEEVGQSADPHWQSKASLLAVFPFVTEQVAGGLVEHVLEDARQ